MNSFTALALFLSLLLFSSCSSFQKPDVDGDRGVASSNSSAIERVRKACDLKDSHFAQLVDENVVEDQAKYLSGGSGFQTFLMKDGRLVIVSGVNSRTKSGDKCKIDHLKLEEGKIESTFANGRRLFMTVMNESGSSRVYFLTAIKNQESPEPYQVHEMKYTSRSSYASAVDFKIVSIKVGTRNRNGIGIVKKDGELYSYRTFKPWEWGDNNEKIQKATNGLARKVVVKDKRQNLQIEKTVKETTPVVDPPVIYLPKPHRSCKVSERVSFFFGLISFTETFTVPCQ